MKLITMEMLREDHNTKISMPMSQYVKGIVDTRDETIDRVLELIEKRSYGGVNINYIQIKSDVLRMKTKRIPLPDLDTSEIKVTKITNLEALGNYATPEKAYYILEWLWTDYAKRYSDSKIAIIDWLTAENKEGLNNGKLDSNF